MGRELMLVAVVELVATAAFVAAGASATSTAVGRSTLVKLTPADCGSGAAAWSPPDCRPAIEAAIAQCRKYGRGCSVELAPGDYRVSCPAAQRPSSTQIEAPAISLARTAGIVFGGGAAAASLPGSRLHRPTVLIDYAGGGCAGIVAENASDVRVQNVVIDAYRAPFTVGRLVADGTATAVSFVPEADPADRPSLYHWNVSRYPWLDTVYTSQVVANGARATRELPDIGLSNSAFTSTFDAETGAVTLAFAQPQAQRTKLRAGQRIFLKHYGNMQSWGVHGQGVRGEMQLSGVSLWSVAGMGFRCDLCEGNYTLTHSDILIRPDSLRPMSITADGVHFMHHSGHITLRDASIEGGGDDGFNVHGNFVVLSSIPPSNSSASAPTVRYVDETGPGWVTAAPTFFIGDKVEFYSRRTLAKLGTSTIRSATASEITFSSPLPRELKLFDMILSLRRVSSLTMERCFFGNSNSRGAVVSAVDVRIVNNTFANLTHPGVIFIEGGCGAQAGDYTEGPFSQNILIEGNTFTNVATVGMQAASVNNLAMLQLTGCRPIGECGVSGQLPPSPSTSSGVPPLPAGGGIMRAVKVEFSALNGAAKLHSLKFMADQPLTAPLQQQQQQQQQQALAGVVMGVYESAVDGTYPTKLLATAGADAGGVVGNDTAAWSWDGHWYRAPLSPVDGQSSGLTLQNGSFWLALWYPPTTPLPLFSLRSGRMQYKSWRTADGLQRSIGANWSDWQTHWYQGLPLAAEWTAVGGWCDSGGTLPPPVVAHAGDNGPGKITEPGAFVEQGAAFHNVTIRGNSFVAQAGPPAHPDDTPVAAGLAKPWTNSFLHIGISDGLTIESNWMAYAAGSVRAAPDLVIYSSTHVTVGANACFNGTQRVECVLANSTS